MKYKLINNDKFKMLRSKYYKFNFDKTTGFFMRWGETKEDDPSYSPFGPEILDLEISTDGCPNNCPFCYKGNTNKPATNMSFDTFKQIIDTFMIPAKLIELEDGRKIKIAGTVKLKNGSIVRVENLKPGDDIDI